MWEWIKTLFTPRPVEGEETQRLRPIMYVILIATMAGIVMLAIGSYVGWIIGGFYLVGPAFFITLTLSWLTLRGHLLIPRLILPTMAYVVTTYRILTNLGTRDPVMFIYPVTIALAGLLLGKRGILAFTSVIILTATGLSLSEIYGLLETPLSHTVGVGSVLTYDIFLGITGILIYLNIESLNQSIDRARRSADELAERTRELEASQRVTFAATEHVTPEELLDLVVNLIRDQFNLYHAQVYLIDEEKQAAVLRQSTGYAGRQLLHRNHRIPLDATALVTQAIHSGEPVLVDDVDDAPNFMANPLLPETRSELVVPLRREGKVIGVLDVQDRTPGRFGPSTVTLFQAMADQTVVLFENNELLAEVTDRTEALTLFSDQLRTAADVARRLATILDPKELLREVVELLQGRFNLYHVHIYLLDAEARMLRMQTGSGEVGRVLKERGHAIPLDKEQSLVARAARSKGTVLVGDTSREPGFMPNPLLPQTRSELAIPLIVSDRVLGVLDLQANEINHFTEIDRDTFRSLAGQVATSLQTADIFEQTQIRLRVSQALADAQTVDEVLEALTEEAAIYPRTQLSIFLNEYEGEERFVVAHRVTSFGIKMQALIAQGTRFPTSQFRLITESSDEGLFVSANFPVDERIDAPTRRMVEEIGAVSMAIVPIRSGDEAFGSIVAASPQEGFFDERRLHLYQTLAEQGAKALHLATLNDEIQANEQQFRSIVEHAHAGILVVNGNFRFIYANDRLAEISGYTVEELLSMDFREVLTEESLQMVSDYYARQRRGEEVPSTYELTIVRKDGERRIGEMSSSVFQDAEGNVRTLAQFLDVTERKQAQAARERFTLQLRTASDIAGQIASILNPEVVLNTVIPLLKERFGLYHAHYYDLDPEDEVLKLRAGYGEPGRQMLEEDHAIPFDREQSLVARAARTREVVVINDVAEAPDFLPNPRLPDTRSEVAVPVISADRVLGVFDVQQDARNYFTEGDVRVFTTLAGQIATALENARLFEQVQEADKLKSEFLANMSHELRTPLNSIIGYAEIMLMGLDDGIDPETLEDVQAIYDNGQHLLRLINDVLDLAKIEAGRMKLKMEEVDISAILDEVLRSNAGLLINKPLDISTQTEEGLPTIKADRVRLSQILNNLFSNAVKFTDKGEIRLHAFRENGWCVIEVADTGVGMGEDDLDVIFERFRQIDGSAARMKDGTGLGLAITSHLVKMHSGTIDVQSEPGKGSTFIVRLPVDSQE